MELGKIEGYLVTVRDNKRRYCPMCDQVRALYVPTERDENGLLRAYCCACSRMIGYWHE